MRLSRFDLLDRPQHLRDARLFVIATEGERTEKLYFELFSSPRVHVIVLSTASDGASGPNDVCNRLEIFRAQYMMEPTDRLWLVADVDRWRPHALRDVCRRCREINASTAISNPCFEVWLIAHFADYDASDKTCRAAKARLDALRTDKRERADYGTFVERTPFAMDRAIALDVAPEKPWPKLPGTHVYRLVRELLDVVGAVSNV